LEAKKFSKTFQINLIFELNIDEPHPFSSIPLLNKERGRG